MRDINKFRGCLTGGAAGDALGYAVEFMGERQIFQQFGSNGITEYSLTGGIALFSDDTQMSLFTADGLLMSAEDGENADITENIALCYRDWYITQTRRFPAEYTGKHSGLLEIPELFSPRAPGMTCLSAIEHGADGTIESPLNNSKGCGGVMRVAPIGLYFSGSKVGTDTSDMLGAKAAALTHGHELGYIPAAALVHIVRAVGESDISLINAVNESISAVERLFPDAGETSRMTRLLHNAAELAYSDTDELNAIHRLGEGWVAEETLAIAVYCSLKHESDFDKALIASVNHKGDSDSTGAVTGNILGAFLGYDAIPDKYKRSLELPGLIIRIADKLYNTPLPV